MASTNATASSQRFWRFLITTTTKGFFLRRLEAKSETTETWINASLALASSTSIAAWAIWEENPFFWAAVVAASQVVTTVKPFLPYRKRQVSTMALINGFFPILLSIEEDWYRICNDNLDSKQIDALLIARKRDLQRIEAEHFNEAQLPRNRSLMAKATAETMRYFENMEETG